MMIAFQILLMLVIVFSFIGAIGGSDKEEKMQMTGICVTSIVAMVVTFVV